MARVPMSFFSLRPTGAALATLGLLATTPVAFAAGEPIQVTVDHAKVMHIARPAEIVIIGNPGIADATIQDAQTLIITGHSFGTTNLIVLDAAGQAIADQLVTVQASDDNAVTVYRIEKAGTSRETLSCTPACAPTLAIGDAPTWFDGVKAQIDAHSGLAAGAGAAK